jgi:predicted  nucleic acid-binding Zn-ribbon protein
MQEEITPEQREQLSSWARKRDTVLAEISVAQIAKEKLERENIALASSTKDIEKRINESQGRMDELNVREKEYEAIVSTELADLTAQKKTLQTEVAALEADIKLLVSKKDLLKETISSLTEAHEKVFARASGLDSTVGDTMRINSQHMRDIQNLLITMKSSVQEVLDVNQLNVGKTNFVIMELPKMFFELQRQVLERKNKHDISRQ